MTQQMQLFEPSAPPLESRIAALDTRLKNMRCGLFKRYEEMKRQMEFLEAELESLARTKIEHIGYYD